MQKENNFHALSIEEILKLTESNKSGLTDEEVKKRISQNGLNIIPEKKQQNALIFLLKQFNSIFVYILLIAAIISYFSKSLVDFYVICAIILINTGIGFAQEYKADKAIKELKKLMVLKSKVIRNNNLTEIPSSELVIGDMIVLEEGDKIPADARLIETSNLKVIESSLTGESFPVEKSINILQEKIAFADRKNMVWMSTFVASGSARAIIIATGKNTAIGKIASEIEKIKEIKSHFNEKTDKLALQMGFIALITSLIVFLIGFYVRGFEFKEIFLFTIASLVAAIPEGLPAVLTIVLAIGAFKMSRKKALIRNLTATETLGIVNTILTDKTGTLTQNTMNVEKIYLPSEQIISITGNAWEPNGDFFIDNNKINPKTMFNLSKLIEIGNVCSKAKIVREKETKIIGDPTEAALIVLGEKSGITKQLSLNNLKILEENPFDSELKYKSIMIEKEKENYIYVIGAPEKIIENSTLILRKERSFNIFEKDKNEIYNNIEEMTSNGLRVLAMAYKKISDKELKISNKLNDLTFVGLVGMKDPVKKEVKEAMQKARNAGIRVIMLTGDHKNTAISVAKEIGLVNEKYRNKNYPLALTEQELLEIDSDKKFKDIINNVSIFARLTPKMKLKIASVLQEQGKIIAMTGDGVNDAPALKKANIGISMGITGTDVARESSDMVLTDDNFASIINAVEEGRIVFLNTKQTSSFLIITNFAESTTIITTILMGFQLPLLPTQILWLNLITDTGPAIGLASEKSNNDTLSYPPRNAKDGIISKSVIHLLLIMTILMTILTLFSFSYFLPESLEKARTSAFAMMMFTQLFNAFNMRSLKKSIIELKIFSNKTLNLMVLLSLIGGLIVMYLPFFQEIFNFVPLTYKEMMGIFLLSSTTIITAEIYKKIKN
jgi:Ca2+-transporting ATPase